MDRKLEQLAIWSLIVSPSDISEVSNILVPDDFIDHTYKHAYQTILKMKAEGREVDLPTLYVEMGRPRNITEIIKSEEDIIFPASHYALLLKKKNIEESIQKSAKEREYDEAKERIKQLEDLGKPTSLLTISTMVEQVGSYAKPYPTGYPDLDSFVDFRPTDLLVLAGRTSIGKSTFGLTVLSNMAKEFPVGMISFEMSPNGIAERLSRICTMNYLNEINSNLFIACPTAFNLQQTRKAISDMVRIKQIRVVMVDYLQLMMESRRFNSRHLEISYIIRQLKEFAKEFQIGMMVVSQLSRGIDARGEKAKPALGDLKETGDIEHASDIVLFLHRIEQEKKAELIVAKNRYGKRGIVTLIWSEARTTYGSWEWKEED